MATRSKKDTDPDESGPENWAMRVPGGIANNDDETPEETAQDRVAFMLRDVRNLQSARVRLYRKNPQSRKLAWCADYSPEEFEGGGFDMIRTQWGPGAYEIRVYGGDAAGAGFGLLGRSELDIVAAAVNAAPATAGMSELSQILARMAEQQASQNQAILQALTNKPDPMASMKESFALMTMMREAMGLNGANAAPPKSSISEIVEAIRELKGAQELIGGEKPEVDADNPLALVPQIIELVKMAAQKNQAPAEITFPAIHTPPGLAAAPSAPALRVVTPAAPAIEPPVTLEPDQVDYIPALLKSFAHLLDLAKRYAATSLDSSQRPGIVEEGAEYVYEQLPDELVEVLQGENWLEALLTVVPEIGEHVGFFTAVRDRALQIFAEESANDASPSNRDDMQQYRTFGQEH